MSKPAKSKRARQPETDLFGEPVRRFATAADAAAVSFERELTTPSAVVECRNTPLAAA